MHLFSLKYSTCILFVADGRHHLSYSSSAAPASSRSPQFSVLRPEELPWLQSKRSQFLFSFVHGQQSSCVAASCCDRERDHHRRRLELTLHADFCPLRTLRAVRRISCVCFGFSAAKFVDGRTTQ